MSQKTVRWKTDNDLKQYLFEDLEKISSYIARETDGDMVLDLGGRGGKLGYETEKDFPVCIDLDPIDRFNKVNYVKGNILRMPFEDETFDLVLAKAILHHIPGDLEKCIKEIHRVTKDGGAVLIEEPTSTNLISNIAHYFFTTTQHDELEEPLDPVKLKRIVSTYYKIQEYEPFFLFTYLTPHIVSRLPEILKNIVREVSKLGYRADKQILDNVSFLRHRSAYISIVGTKR